MSQLVTLKMKVEFKEGGPKIPEAKAEFDLSTYVPMIEEVPNDKQWQTYELQGGARERLAFLMVSADQYVNDPKECARPDEAWLWIRFAEHDGDNPEKSYALRGATLYTGASLEAIEPAAVNYIQIKNCLAKATNVYVLLGRYGQFKGNPCMNGQAAPVPAVAAP